MPNLKAQGDTFQWKNQFEDYQYGKYEEEKVKTKLYESLKNADAGFALGKNPTDWISELVNRTTSNYVLSLHQSTFSKPKGAPKREAPSSMKAEMILKEENRLMPAVIKVTSIYRDGRERNLGNIKFDISEEKQFYDLMEQKRIELERLNERKKFEAQEDKALNGFLKSVAIATTALLPEDYFFRTKSCRSTISELASNGMLDKFIGYMKNMGITIPESEKNRYVTLLKLNTPTRDNFAIDDIKAEDVKYIPYEQRDNLTEMINRTIVPVDNIAEFNKEASNIVMDYVKNSHEVSMERLLIGIEDELNERCREITQDDTIEVRLNVVDNSIISSYDIYIHNAGGDDFITSEPMENNGMLLAECYKTINTAYMEAVDKFQNTIDFEVSKLTENKNITKEEIEQALTDLFQQRTDDYSTIVTIEPTYLGYSYEIRSIEENYAEENMYFRGNFSTASSDRMIEVLERNNREEEEIEEL